MKDAELIGVLKSSLISNILRKSTTYIAIETMRQRIFHIIIVIIFIGVAAIVARMFFQSKVMENIPVKTMRSPQDADAPLGFPIQGKPAPFDPRFIQLSAFERANIPTTPRMALPLGSEQGALTYDAQPFWSNNPQRGGHHSGDDLNGIGGMNTDLGDPVYAIGRGLVVYRGIPSPGWGNTLILAHRTTKGEIKLSMYAHLSSSYVAYGELVYHGERLGSVGTAGLLYPAHLHFEMHNSTGIYIGAGYGAHPGDRIPPSQWITKHQAQDISERHTPPLQMILATKLSEQHDNILIQSQSTTAPLPPTHKKNR